MLMRGAEEEAWWLGRVSECVCVYAHACVCLTGAQYRQLIPTFNTAAALLGQCAIVSFIIITACFSSCALSPHPSHVFLQSRRIPFTCRFESWERSNSGYIFGKQDGCLYCGRLQRELKPPENSTPGDCLLCLQADVAQYCCYSEFSDTKPDQVSDKRCNVQLFNSNASLRSVKFVQVCGRKFQLQWAFLMLWRTGNLGKSDF